MKIEVSRKKLLEEIEKELNEKDPHVLKEVYDSCVNKEMLKECTPEEWASRVEKVLDVLDYLFCTITLTKKDVDSIDLSDLFIGKEILTYELGSDGKTLVSFCQGVKMKNSTDLIKGEPTSFLYGAIF